jgi:hypothetical protein
MKWIPIGLLAGFVQQRDGFKPATGHRNPATKKRVDLSFEKPTLYSKYNLNLKTKFQKPDQK